MIRLSNSTTNSKRIFLGSSTVEQNFFGRARSKHNELWSKYKVVSTWTRERAILYVWGGEGKRREEERDISSYDVPDDEKRVFDSHPAGQHAPVGPPEHHHWTVFTVRVALLRLQPLQKLRIIRQGQLG